MGVRTIAVTITADGADLRAELERDATAVERFSKRVSKAGTGSTSGIKATGAAAKSAAKDVSTALDSTAAAATRSSQATVTALDSVATSTTRSSSKVAASTKGAAAAQDEVGKAAGKAAGEVEKGAAKAEQSWTSAFEQIGRGSGYAFGGGALAQVGYLGALGVAAYAVGTAITSAASASAQFEVDMRNVNSITHLSESAFQDLSKRVLDLSTTLPQSADNLAQALYQIASSGFAGADGLAVLQASATAASAGLATTDQAAQGIVAVLNAYGLSAASAKSVSDVLFQTVNVGVTTFGDLSTEIGSFIGIAAQAHVPLAAVSSAFATITLQGVSSAEAATQTSRLLEALIKPSTALAATYQQLGYTSGAAALQNKGLAGVMGDLQKATGGNITTLLQLFPEIRAARGALALMSNEGKNYARVASQIDGGNASVGATAAALAEQAKSASYQFGIFKNEVAALAIQLGNHLSPAVIAVLHGLEAAGGGIDAALAPAQPLFEALYRSGVNIAEIFATITKTTVQLAGALLAAFAGPALAAVTELARGLAALTGYLVEHKGLTLALATAYVTFLTPALSLAGAALTRLLIGPLIALALRMRVAGLAVKTFGAEVAIGGAVAEATTAVTAFGKSLVSLENIATLGLTAVIFGATQALDGFSRSADQGKSSIDSLVKGGADTASLTSSLGAVQQAVDQTQFKVDQYDSTLAKAGKSLEDLGSLLTGGESDIQKWSGALDEGHAKLDQLRAQLDNTHENLTVLSQATGLSTDALEKLAIASNIDLSKPYTQSKPARDQLLSYLDDLRKQTGLTADATDAAVGTNVDAWQALSKAIADAADAATKAFQGATDPLANYDPSKYADAVTKAEAKVAKARGGTATGTKTSLADEQRLARARQALADVEARVAVTAHKTAASQLSAQQQIARAKQRVADTEAAIAAKGGGAGAAGSGLASAQAALAKAKADQAAHGLETTYKTTVASARTFVEQIAQVTEKGLDPRAVQELLQQGPEKAAPILQTLVSDNSGRLIKMVNDSRAALDRINAQVVEQSRLVALAVNSSTDQLSRELPAAMRIAQAEAAAGGRATAEALAASLHLPQSEVDKVAADFGIQLATGVQAAVQAKPINVKVGATVVTLSGQAGANDPLFGRNKRAGGGQVLGPGSTTSDSIPALLSNREFVQRAAAVDYYGVGVMHELNAMRVPAGRLRAAVYGAAGVGRFAGGGLVGVSARGVGGTSALAPLPAVRTVIVRVPVRETTTHHHPVTVGQVVTRDARSFARDVAGASALSAV